MIVAVEFEYKTNIKVFHDQIIVFNKAALASLKPRLFCFSK